MNRRRLIKLTITLMLIIIVYKCEIPLHLKPLSTPVFCNSKEEAIAAERSVWIYKPVCDTLIIKDSIRNLKFHIQSVYAYDSRLLTEFYLWLFLPWAELNNFGDVKYFTVCFDYINLHDKWDPSMGIVMNISDSATTKTWNRISYEEYRDDSIIGQSYYESIKSVPLPDTLYLTVWGQKDLFVPSSIFKNLPDSIKSKAYSAKYDKGQIKLGQIALVKSDSIICPKKRKAHETKLFVKKLRML